MRTVLALVIHALPAALTAQAAIGAPLYQLPMTAEQTAAVATHEKEVAELKKKLDAAKKAEGSDPNAAMPRGKIEIDALPGIVIDDTQVYMSTSLHVVPEVVQVVHPGLG